jgi:serine-type D-Ala-D-Ala carboxypeptidase (penicillin-binding protein 5/6)
MRAIASLFYILIATGCLADLGAEAPRGGAPDLNARSAIVVEFATGKALYEKDADEPIPPASLTKLMSLHIAYKALAQGRISLDDIVTIKAQDCYPYLSWGSSLMYLEPGMRVSVRDLMLGMAVVSGNDAAFSLARYISGSPEAFAEEMNKEARAMGYKTMHFVEPSGLSEKNMITAREYADFCRRYLLAHPNSIEELHSVRSLVFPKLENMPIGYKGKERAQTVYNRNQLIFEYPGCDGLKTGFIVESGFNLAVTAKRGATRFIAVTLGGSGVSSWGGGAIRAADGAKLLDYAFARWITVEPAIVSIQPIRVWKGEVREVGLEPDRSLPFTVAREDSEGIVCKVEKEKSIVAPVAKGTKLGELVFSVRGKVLERIPLVAKDSVAKGNLFVVVRDSAALFFSRLTNPEQSSR